MKKVAAAASDSATDVASWTKDLVLQHAPSPEELQAVKSRTLELAKNAGERLRELGSELADSKIGKDAAKGALVGGVIAVPVPLIGPIFGAAVGAIAGIYLGQLGGSESARLPMPAEGSDMYKRLLELEALREQKIISREQFESQVQRILDECSQAAMASSKGDQPATGTEKAT
ncbi:hypothetical protein [Ramlibacter albus]|uniref:Uncharacterized protein n=1 Tax=Ramlibacter albus TaxID=2079448 RepID=A0A923S5K9_9BURK|nr:hypothetical protein [Ramlibacter albus]MBC5768680.1 hypothetical protein [Ramlibacter albus]